MLHQSGQGGQVADTGEELYCILVHQPLLLLCIGHPSQGFIQLPESGLADPMGLGHLLKEAAHGHQVLTLHCEGGELAGHMAAPQVCVCRHDRQHMKLESRAQASGAEPGLWQLALAEQLKTKGFSTGWCDDCCYPPQTAP